ncbi:RNA polymerase sigma factor [Bacteroides sp.]
MEQSSTKVNDSNVEQQFMSLIREYERVIYKVCYLYTTKDATLSDLYQDVVLNLWKAFPKFRGECKMSTWIYRIALNTCISFIRKAKNVPEIVTLTHEADWMTEEKDEFTELLRELYRMINHLGQLDKSIILLYLEEKSYEEIAEITGLTVTNVATKISRIKDKLKKMKKED